MSSTSEQDDRQSLRERDLRTDRLLGAFFLVLGVTVSVGVVFAELAIDRLINVVAASLLLLVGAGFLLRGRALRRRG